MTTTTVARWPLLIAALALSTLILLLAVSSPSAAQITAYTTTSVNQRAGPGTDYPVIVTAPARAQITVHGCLETIEWCDVDYADNRGWINATYIQAYYNGQYYLIGQVASQVRVTIIAFDIDGYWGSYYRSRPFYADLPRWSGGGGGGGASINVSVFYDRLSPHGRWVDIRGRYVWVPANVDRDWRPYTHGRWVYTNRNGWMWVSDEPFGWATYHYGRWAFSKRVGWFWVPGTRWAPAWVAWRGSGDYLAWAPLPPSPDEGFSIEISFGEVPDYYWQVVPVTAFLSVNLSDAIIRDQNQFQPLLRETQPLGTVDVSGEQVVNAAVGVNFIEEKTREQVVRHEVTETNDPGQPGAVQGGRVQVFTPPPGVGVGGAPANQPPQVVPIEQVEQNSPTKDQAGAQPETEGRVRPAPAPGDQPPAVQPLPAPVGPAPPTPGGNQPPAAQPPADQLPPRGQQPAPPSADQVAPPAPQQPPPPPQGRPAPPAGPGQVPPPAPLADQPSPPAVPAQRQPPPPPTADQAPPPPAPPVEQPAPPVRQQPSPPAPVPPPPQPQAPPAAQPAPPVEPAPQPPANRPPAAPPPPAAPADQPAPPAGAGQQAPPANQGGPAQRPGRPCPPGAVPQQDGTCAPAQ